ncbi:MAG: threonine synthase [Pseudomonadota bacterium]
MHYVSTRGTAPVLDFQDCMLAGLARDGGLYVPHSWPSHAPEVFRSLRGARYEDAAHQIMRPFIGDAFSSDDLAAAIDRAYASFGHAARCPLVQLGDNDWMVELHHGPTLAFKDVALQLVAQLFELALTRLSRRVTIVGATSGDTGSAAIEAFRGRDTADVFILYPNGRVSEVQRRQMTTPDAPNVHALAIDGDFDTCQALVKAMFSDEPFRDEVGLAAINSINWARVLAQTVYFVTAGVALGAPDRPVSFSVPTGNFGDIFAGYVAKRMGLPIDRLVIATNRNDILHRTLQTGAHEKAGVTPTVSPSMDIEVSSNFERLLFDLAERDGTVVAGQMDDLRQRGGFRLSNAAMTRLQGEFDSARADEAETNTALRETLAATGQLVCPHTAVGLHAAQAVRDDPAVPMITLATAHAAKFPDAVEAATGTRPALPPRLAGIMTAPERITVLPGELGPVQSWIREHRR